MNGQFNAIDYAQQLEAAGVPQGQAEVHAKMLALALVSCAASRADLAALGDKLGCRMDGTRADLAALGDKLNSRIDASCAELRSEMAALSGKLNGRIDALETRVTMEMAAVRAEIRHQSKLFGLAFATNTTLTIAVLVKQFFP